MKRLLRLQVSISIAIMLISFFSIGFQSVQSSVEETFHASVTDDYVLRKAELILEIPIKTTINEDEWITLLFPDVFPVPPYSTYHDDTGKEYTTEQSLMKNIEVNFLSLDSNKPLPIINYAENSLSFVMPRTLRIRSTETTWLWITMRYQLPGKPCEGSFGFWHNSLDKPLYSNLVQVFDTIMKPGIENLTLAISNPVWNQPTNWQFTCQTNNKLVLYKNIDYLSISFGKSVELPVVIHPEFVFINDVPAYQVDRNGDGYKIFIPLTIHENQPIKLIIWEQFGIKTPQKNGSYDLKFDIVSKRFYNLMEAQTLSLDIQPGDPFVKISNPMTENQATYTLHWMWNPPYATDTSMLQIRWPNNFPLEEESTVSALLNETSVSGTYQHGIVSFPLKNTGSKNQLVSLFLKQFKTKHTNYQYFINPSPGKLQFAFRYHPDLDWIPFQEVDILPGKLHVIYTDLENRYASQPIGLTIGFAANNEMNAICDKGIYLVFSDNIIFPTEINIDSIVFRHYNSVTVKYTMIDQHTLLIRTEKKDDPMLTYYKDSWSLQIDNRSGILNPIDNSGKVSIRIHTDLNEPPDFIADWSVVRLQEKTSILVEGGKVGKDNWYTSPPTIKINHGQEGSYINLNWIMFELPIHSIPLLQGQNIQLFYLKNDFPHQNSYQSDSVEAKVDTVPVEISLEKPSLSWSITNQSQFRVKGKMKIPYTMDKGTLKNLIDQSLQIQNRIVLIKTDGSFEDTVSLKKGKNDIFLEVSDWAGHQWNRTIHVVQGNGIILQIGSKKVWFPDRQVETDTPPIISRNRTFVPLRLVSEAFGATVTYRSTTKPPSVLITRNKQRIELFIGSKTALVDNQSYPLPEAPFIQENRMMVPLKFLADIWKMETIWEAVDSIVTLLFQ